MARGDFDLHALHAAVDERRAARGLSWAAAAREIGVSAATLRGVRARAAVEGDGVLRMLLWLERAPESFVPDGTHEPPSPLPAVRPPDTLRFDARALYAALDEARSARRLTWAEVATATGVGDATALTRLQAGGRVTFPGVMRLLGWLGAPASRFVRATLQ